MRCELPGVAAHCRPRPRTRCSGSICRWLTVGQRHSPQPARQQALQQCRRPRSVSRRRCWPGAVRTAGISCRSRWWRSMPIFAGCPGMAVISAPLVTPPRFRVVSRRGHRNNSVMSDGNTMRAWSVRHPAPMSQGPLISQELPVPDPAEHEVLVRVSVCGVCRTDLHVAEGDLPVHRAHVVPGHEVVGTVVGRGSAVQDMRARRPGRHRLAAVTPAAGAAYCRRDAENLCPASRFTGWDADGGYAEFAMVAARLRLPTAGRIRRRDARTAAVRGHHRVPRAAPQRIGARRPARDLRLRRQRAPDSTGGDGGVRRPGARDDPLGGCPAGWPPTSAPTPLPEPTTNRREPLDAAILFAPVGDLVPPAMRALDRGGILAVAGIHLTDVPSLNYGTNCSTSANSEVSPPTPGRTVGTSSRWPVGTT